MCDARIEPGENFAIFSTEIHQALLELSGNEPRDRTIPPKVTESEQGVSPDEVYEADPLPGGPGCRYPGPFQ